MTEGVRVLCVGAAGRFAGMVVPELAKRGVRIRALIRDASQEDQVRALGAAEIAVADLSDRHALGAALSDIDRMFYIAPAFSENEAGLGQGVVEVAKQSGVRRFVFSSVIHPILGALSNHAAKGPVEEAILTSGMEYTFLHPAVFFQNYAAGWDAVTKTGMLAEPYSAEKRMTRVDYRDVAEVAAIALTEDRLLHGTFELCAAGDLNRRDVSALMSQVLGRKVSSATPTFTEWTKQAEIPREEGQLAPLEAMYDWYDRHELLGNSSTLRGILGREPRTLLQYFKELANSASR